MSVESNQGFTGVWISKEVLNSTELTPSEKIIFANIASFDKCCFETNERLAEKCGVDESTVKRALRKLSAQGFIVIEFVNNNSSKRRIYAILDNPKKIKYLVKKGLFPQENDDENRGESKSFPQVGQNDPAQNAPAQNDLPGGQNDLPQNRGEVGQNAPQRINKKKEEKGNAEQKPNLNESAGRVAFESSHAPASSANRMPKRNNYPDDDSFEEAFYAWNVERCATTT